MKSFEQIIADIAAGKLPDPHIEDVSGAQPASDVGRKLTDEEMAAEALIDHPEGTTPEARQIYGGLGETPEQKAQRRAKANALVKAADKLRRQENLKKARAAKAAKLKVLDPVKANPTHSERMKEIWRRRKEAANNGGDMAVQESLVQEQGGRKAGELGEVRGHDQGPGLSSNGMPDLSSSGGSSGAEISGVRPNDAAPGQGVQPQLGAGLLGLSDQQIRAAIAIAVQPCFINIPRLLAMPLEAAEHALSAHRDQVAAAGVALQARRTEEVVDDSSKCTWCNTPFAGPYFARFPFELEAGSGQWRAIYSCRRGDCLAKFNAAVDKIQSELKAERSR